MKLMDTNANSSEQAHEHILGDFDTLVTENTDLCRWYRTPEAKLCTKAVTSTARYSMKATSSECT
jgi:hypothetical protein